MLFKAKPVDLERPTVVRLIRARGIEQQSTQQRGAYLVIDTVSWIEDSRIYSAYVFELRQTVVQDRIRGIEALG